MWHACRLHLASETLMWASMAFWRGEQAYCLCFQPCFKHLWSWQYMTVSNKDVLLAVASCFLCSLCCRELYVVTLFQYSRWTIRLCVQELPLVSANSLNLSLCALLTSLSSSLICCLWNENSRAWCPLSPPGTEKLSVVWKCTDRMWGRKTFHILIGRRALKVDQCRRTRGPVRQALKFSSM